VHRHEIGCRQHAAGLREVGNAEGALIADDCLCEQVGNAGVILHDATRVVRRSSAVAARGRSGCRCVSRLIGVLASAWPRICQVVENHDDVEQHLPWVEAQRAHVLHAQLVALVACMVDNATDWEVTGATACARRPSRNRSRRAD